MDPNQASSASMAARAILKVDQQAARPQEDWIALEEPLEIRLVYSAEGQRQQKSLAITMRTPGHDEELAAGFLLSEGLVRNRSEILGIAPCGPTSGESRLRNVLKVELAPHVVFDLERLERHFYATSSCGVCGKSSIEAVSVAHCRTIPVGFEPLSPEIIHQLPDRLRAAQAIFDRTGGLHAAAWFDRSGELRALREDVGRHNALDKLIGASWLADGVPLSAGVVFLSGRISFELVQKALVAGVPILAAVGAPSSLAVDLARRFHMTLLGFVRAGRFNVYAGPERLLLPASGEERPLLREG